MFFKIDENRTGNTERENSKDKDVPTDTDFKAYINENTEKNENAGINKDINGNRNESIIDEGRKTFEIEIEELKKLKDRLDSRFEKAVNTIFELKNNKVVVTGIGKSGHIGAKIAATFASTGTSSVFMNAAEALHGDLGMVSKGDVVIAISNSGNSDEILSILTPIKKIGAKLIAFTGNEKSPLAKNADITLNIGVEREASSVPSAPMSSTTATLVMGDALASVLMKKRNFTDSDFAKYHPGGSLGKRLLLTVRDLMHSGEEFPVLSVEEEIEKVLLVLTKKKMGAVCISDTGREKGKLIGIITEGDIRRALVHKEKFFSYKAKDIMTENPVSIEMNAMALKALHLMENRKSQINVLPVVDEGKVVGIIRIHDLVGLR